MRGSRPSLLVLVAAVALAGCGGRRELSKAEAKELLSPPFSVEVTLQTRPMAAGYGRFYAELEREGYVEIGGQEARPTAKLQPYLVYPPPDTSSMPVVIAYNVTLAKVELRDVIRVTALPGEPPAQEVEYTVKATPNVLAPIFLSFGPYEADVIERLESTVHRATFTRDAGGWRRLER